MFVSARSFAEYVMMFNLGDLELRSQLLDVAAGAASFTAEACHLGYDAVALDPLYSLDLYAVVDRAIGGVAEAWENVNAQVSSFQWDGFFTGRESHGLTRLTSAAAFLNHLMEAPERYISHSMPNTNIPSRAFDTVLSSHFLFTHAASLSPEAHVRITLEMVRLARAEVRIYPLVGFYGDATRHLNVVQSELSRRGIEWEVRDSSYKFHPGADSFLRIIAPPE